MPCRRLYASVALVALILVPGLSFAQSLPEPPPLQPLPEMPVAPAVVESPAEEVVSPPRILRIQPNTVTSGDKGDVILDGSAPGFTTDGVFLRANTAAVPGISAQLGTSDTTSHFSIFDAANTRLWFVRGDGLARLTRNYNGATSMEIANGNPGSAAATASTNLKFMEGEVVKALVTSVGSGSTASVGGANSFHLWNNANGPILLGTNNVERMRIESNGNVGIDTRWIPAGGKLHIIDWRDNARGLEVSVPATVEQNTSQRDLGGIISAYEIVSPGVTNSDAVIGLQVVASKGGSGNLAYTVGQEIHGGVMAGHSGTVTSAYGLSFYFSAGNGTVSNAYALHIPDIPAGNAYAVWQAGGNDKNYFAGKVGIGTLPTANALEVLGNANFQGTVTGTNIQASYQDLAEWVPATTDMVPGTVVILNPDKANEVMPSSRAYDTSVAGVVSAQPGILLGEAGPSKEQIATTGRVKVRVDAIAGPIRIGDLLVTGNKPGVAMKSAPLDFNGVPLHRPGTVLGKALEPLAEGTGEILVLLSLQ